MTCRQRKAARLGADWHEDLLNQIASRMGLYATGNNSGGRFPMGYNGIMNGVSIGTALTLGMTLGERPAKKVVE